MHYCHGHYQLVFDKNNFFLVLSVSVFYFSTCTHKLFVFNWLLLIGQRDNKWVGDDDSSVFLVGTG